MVLMPCFFIRPTMAWAITSLLCGRRKVQASPPGGRPTGLAASCTVPLSAATAAIGPATGVAAEPMIRSTLSSVTKRLAFCTPLVGSVASSRMIRLTFSPAMLGGKSLKKLPIGMPRPEAGPVSGRLMPMFTSARAGTAAVKAARAVANWAAFTTRVLRNDVVMVDVSFRGFRGIKCTRP